MTEVKMFEQIYLILCFQSHRSLTNLKISDWALTAQNPCQVCYSYNFYVLKQLLIWFD